MNEATMALPDLTATYYFALRELAEATLAALDDDTPQTRGRAWHLAHRAQGHTSWCGVRIDPAQFETRKGLM